MSVSNFNTPSPIAVTLDLYVADVRFAVSDRTDTIVEVRPSDPEKAADVKAAENTRVEYDDATRTLSVVSRKPRNRFVNFSSKRPESIDVVIQLPADSDVRGEAGLGDFQADGVLGTVELKTDLGAVHFSETGPLNVRNGAGAITVEGISGTGNNATVTLRNPWESNPNGGGPLITIPMSVLMGSGTPRWGDHPVNGINIGNM